MTEVTENLSVARPGRIRFGRSFERVALLLVWLGLIAVYGWAMPQSFLTWGNFSILFASYAPAAMLALAIIVPLTAGDYDLSVGATLTLSSAVIGVLNVWMHMPILLVLAIVIVIGVIVGLVNALFILFFRIPSLVVTLGTTSVISGLVQWITNSSTSGASTTRWSWQSSAAGLRRALCVLLRARCCNYHVVRVRLHTARPPAVVRGAWPGGRAAQRNRSIACVSAPW